LHKVFVEQVLEPSKARFSNHNNLVNPLFALAKKSCKSYNPVNPVKKTFCFSKTKPIFPTEFHGVFAEQILEPSKARFSNHNNRVNPLFALAKKSCKSYNPANPVKKNVLL
jgi:hypothetical protein